MHAQRRCRAPALATQLEHHIEGAGYPVPAVLEAPDGATVVEVDGDPWTLSAFVIGEEYDYADATQVEEAGRRLAEFHLLGADFRDAIVRTGLEISPGERYILNAEAPRLLRGRLADAGFADDLAELDEWVREELAAWPSDRYGALPNALLHGDYHGRNLIFEGSTVAALIDFDMVERGPFVLDIARALPAFGRPRRGSYEIRVEVARRFVEAYSAIRPLGDDERAAIPLFAALWEAPVDAFYDLHPKDRLDPIKAARSHFDHWRRVVGQRAALEEAVAHG